jgi:AcrR family transcriptional regulator
MAEDGFRRARRPEQKAQRRQAILAAASALLESHGLDGVSLAAIARDAGLVKSNLYRYFESREELLMWLLLADLQAAVDEIAGALAPPGGVRTAAAVAGTIAAAYASRPRLCLLASRMASVLEHNISEERLIAFKQAVAVEVAKAAAALRAARPDIAEADALRAVLAVHTLVSGLWPAANPPPGLGRVLERPEFRAFRVDFAAVLAADMATFIRGLAPDPPGSG